jgi:hypothetical protein
VGIYFFGKIGDPEEISRIEAYNSPEFSDKLHGIISEAIENLKRKK